MDVDTVYDEILDISPNAYHVRSRKRILYTWDKVSPFLKSNSTVVEIGVGPISALINRLNVNVEVIGIDLNRSQESICDEFGIDLRTCDIQVESLPLENESVDVILVLEVIEHLCMYPNDLFDEIYRKLKKGGYLVVSTANLLRFSNRVRVLLGKNPLINYFERTDGGRNHIREFLPNEISYYMEKSGFSVVEKYLLGIAVGNAVLSSILRVVYLYPSFRNYFIVIGKK